MSAYRLGNFSLRRSAVKPRSRVVTIRNDWTVSIIAALIAAAILLAAGVLMYQARLSTGRYGGVLLLVGMVALVIGVLSFAQVQLSRRAGQLAQVNARLQEEIEERRKTEDVLRHTQKMEAIGQLS